MTTYPEKLPLYSMATASHRVLADEWLLPSLPPEFDARIDYTVGEGGIWRSKAFSNTVHQKALLIRKAVEDNMGHVFVWADADIQFFGPVKDRLLSLLGSKDIMFQRDSCNNIICTGFFIMRCSPRTLRFWNAVCTQLPFVTYDDQDMVNWLLGNIAFMRRLPLPKRFTNPWGIRWGLLPDIFYGPGTRHNKRWNPGDSLIIPDGIVMHHANWTIGVENKIAQLEYVRALVKSRT